jgi:uncharacterized membrane protein SirB2
MTPSLKIRRSGAYGIAGVVVLMASLFLPMSTPRWFVTLTWLLIAGFAGAAVFFSSRERNAGQAGRSVGTFTLAVLVVIVAALIVSTLVL